MVTYYDFLRAFIDFFFYPLKNMELDNYIYTVVFVVIITLVIYTFVKGVLSCFST